MANLWFRLYTEWLNDPKIQSMDETSQRRHIAVLCLRGDGQLEKLSDDEIAVALRITLEELQKTKALFIQKGFIDENWNVPAWGNRQYQSDKSSERTKAYRERKKRDAVVTSQERHCDDVVTAPDTDTDTDTEREVRPTVFVKTPTEFQPDEPGDDKNTNTMGKFPACPYETLVDRYHEFCPSLDRVLKITEARKRTMRARWREILSDYDEDITQHDGVKLFDQFFMRVRDSDFLCGRVQPYDRNKKPFIANLDWIMAPSNFVKILEGKYDAKAKAS